MSFGKILSRKKLTCYKLCKVKTVKSFNKTPLEKNGCLKNSLGYFAMSPSLWLLRPMKVSTSSELYLEFFWLPTFLNCLGNQFFDSPLSQNSQLVYLWLPTRHHAAPVWLAGRYVTPLVTTCFQPNLYLGKQKISLEVTSILTLLTSLVWLQPIIINFRLVFNHVKNQKYFTCGKGFSKKAQWIS